MNKKLTLKKSVLKNLGDSDIADAAGGGRFSRRFGRFIRRSGVVSAISRAATGDRSQRSVNRVSLAAGSAVLSVVATPASAASAASAATYSAVTGEIVDN